MGLFLGDNSVITKIVDVIFFRNNVLLTNQIIACKAFGSFHSDNQTNSSYIQNDQSARSNFCKAATEYAGNLLAVARTALFDQLLAACLSVARLAGNVPQCLSCCWLAPSIMKMLINSITFPFSIACNYDGNMRRVSWPVSDLQRRRV